MFNVVLILCLLVGVPFVCFILGSEIDRQGEQQEQEQEKVQVMFDKENETICYYTSKWGQCLWVDVSK